MIEEKITETFIVDKIVEFLCNKENGNWHEDKTKKATLHTKGVDIRLIGGKRNSEYFFIECKGKSYSPSAKSINRECWLNALGQLITRMEVCRFSKPKDGKTIINRAYKYGLGLYWQSAQVALRRIPKEIAKTLNLYIFSCNDAGVIKQFTPRDFGKRHSDEEFL